LTGRSRVGVGSVGLGSGGVGADQLQTDLFQQVLLQTDAPSRVLLISLELLQTSWIQLVAGGQILGGHRLEELFVRGQGPGFRVMDEGVRVPVETLDALGHLGIRLGHPVQRRDGGVVLLRVAQGILGPGPGLALRGPGIGVPIQSGQFLLALGPGLGGPGLGIEGPILLQGKEELIVLANQDLAGLGGVGGLVRQLVPHDIGDVVGPAVLPQQGG